MEISTGSSDIQSKCICYTQRTFVSGQMLMKLSFVIFLSWWRSFPGYFVTFSLQKNEMTVCSRHCSLPYFFNVFFNGMQFFAFKTAYTMFYKDKNKTKEHENICKQISAGKCAIYGVTNSYQKKNLYCSNPQYLIINLSLSESILSCAVLHVQYFQCNKVLVCLFVFCIRCSYKLISCMRK